MLSIKDKNWYYNKMFYITDKQVFNDFKKLLEKLKVFNLDNQYVLKDFNSFKFIREKPYYRISNSSSFGNGTFDGYKKYPDYANYEVIELKSVDYNNHMIDYNSWEKFKNVNNIVLNNQAVHVSIPTIDLDKYKIEPTSCLTINSDVYDYIYNGIIPTASACCIDTTKCDSTFITATDWNTDNSNIKEEKENMELLNIFIDRKRELLTDQREIEFEDVRECDETYRKAKELGNDVKFVGKFSQEILDDLDEIAKRYEEEIAKLSKFKKEVEAQLEICETYDQKIDILKLYNILDNKGKLSI